MGLISHLNFSGTYFLFLVFEEGIEEDLIWYEVDYDTAVTDDIEEFFLSVLVDIDYGFVGVARWYVEEVFHLSANVIECEGHHFTDGRHFDFSAFEYFYEDIVANGCEVTIHRGILEEDFISSGYSFLGGTDDERCVADEFLVDHYFGKGVDRECA